MAIIEVSNLIKRYGSYPAVNDISFTVQEGEFFGFLGPNGAGKTTTINILCTLLAPTSGRASINGHDCTFQSNRVRYDIGLVFQDPTIDERLTAYENLKFHCYLYGMDSVTTEKRIKDLLGVMDLYDRRNELVKRFSGGMKRRLEIARGILHYPKVLFLDEPTIGLDLQTRIHIWKFIERLRTEEKITVFLSTQYLEEAESCDRLGIIDYGKIISCGEIPDLKSKIRKDIIQLTTKNNKKAQWEIEKKFYIKVYEKNNVINIKVDSAREFMPKLIRELSVPIIYCNIIEPTLNDVFIELTGREMRSVNGSEKDTIRTYANSRAKFF